MAVELCYELGYSCEEIAHDHGVPGEHGEDPPVPRARETAEAAAAAGRGRAGGRGARERSNDDARDLCSTKNAGCCCRGSPTAASARHRACARRRARARLRASARGAGGAAPAVRRPHRARARHATRPGPAFRKLMERIDGAQRAGGAACRRAARGIAPERARRGLAPAGTGLGRDLRARRGARHPGRRPPIAGHSRRTSRYTSDARRGTRTCCTSPSSARSPSVRSSELLRLRGRARRRGPEQQRRLRRRPGRCGRRARRARQPASCARWPRGCSADPRVRWIEPRAMQPAPERCAAEPSSAGPWMRTLAQLACPDLAHAARRRGRRRRRRRTRPRCRAIVVAFANEPHSAPGPAGTTGSHYVGGGYRVSQSAQRRRSRVARTYALRAVASWPIRGARDALRRLRDHRRPRGERGARRARKRHSGSCWRSRCRSSTRSPRAPDPQAAYNDPLYDLQTNLTALGIARAHERAQGAGLRVALIDTAVDEQASGPRRPHRAQPLLHRHDRASAPALQRHGTAMAGHHRRGRQQPHRHRRHRPARADRGVRGLLAAQAG